MVDSSPSRPIISTALRRFVPASTPPTAPSTFLLPFCCRLAVVGEAKGEAAALILIPSPLVPPDFLDGTGEIGGVCVFAAEISSSIKPTVALVDDVAGVTISGIDLAEARTVEVVLEVGGAAVVGASCFSLVTVLMLMGSLLVGTAKTA